MTDDDMKSRTEGKAAKATAAEPAAGKPADPASVGVPLAVPDAAQVGRILREAAAAEILPRFQKLAAHEHRFKGPDDPVTTADEGAERLLTERLCALDSGSVALGEEAAHHDPRRLDLLKGDRPVWVIDPVDGTQNFAHGIPAFAVIVAYVVAGETQGGWILDPLSDALAWAGRGQGAWIEGRAGPVRVPPAPPIAEMTGSIGDRIRHRIEHAARAPGAAPAPHHWVRHRCCGRDYIDLARGRIHFARYGGRLKPWDHAAGALLYAEAGGVQRLMGKGAPYGPAGGIVEDALLLAPGEESWRALHSLLTAH
jgi:fructose-1,6-bisphosphatase/inositol monophosphatase family enzyme